MHICVFYYVYFIHSIFFNQDESNKKLNHCKCLCFFSISCSVNLPPISFTHTQEMLTLPPPDEF